MSAMSTAASWQIAFPPRPQARLRVYCFPFGGHGAAAYRDWSRYLPPSVEVRAVRLPGRYERRDEACLADYTSLVASLVQALADDFAELPFTFFGHCVGALMAHQLALALARLALPGPQLLALAGFAPPGVPRLAEVFEGRTDAELTDILASWGTPKAVLADPESSAAVLRSLRGDAGVWRSAIPRYATAPHNGAPERAPCPIAAYCGVADRLFPPEEFLAWRDHTNDFLGVRPCPGSHIFPTTDTAHLVGHVATDLQTACPQLAL
jgi:medium-chain acyl-[acyl-carrier-protein] hydrolase